MKTKTERRTVTLAVAAAGCVVGGMALASAAHAQSVLNVKDFDPAVGTFGVQDLAPAKAPKPATPSWSEQLGLLRMIAPETRFGALDVAALRMEDELDMGGPLRISINRDAAITGADGQWLRLGDGSSLWIADILAQDAVGVRLHIVGADLPRGAELAVFSPDNPEIEPHRFTGRGPFQSGEFWTPTVLGQRVRVEYYVPAALGDKHGHDVPFVIDQINQAYRDIFTFRDDRDGGIAGAGGCHNDPACFPEWSNVSNSVGRLAYISGGVGYVCSGQLITTVANDFTPYYLTAAHCISNNSEANSAEITWRYRRNTCGGSVGVGPTSTYAVLQSVYGPADVSLILIEGTLPSGLFWSGWVTSTPASGTLATCLHHPAGSYQRITFGSKLNTPVCGGSSTNFFTMNWNDGVTEPGSSGSGIFRNDTQQLFGTLTCGFSSCSNPTGRDSYGQFARAYGPGNFSTHLQQGSDDAFEPNDSCNQATSIAPGTYMNRVVKSVSEDWYRFNLPTGANITINLTFNHAWGDIDCQLYRGCGGTLVASSTSSTNNESINYTNNGASGDFYLRVYLHNDTRNQYDLSIVTGAPGNDACNDGPLVLAGSVGFTTIGATTDGPNEPGLCNFSGYSHLEKDVWFKYFAQCTGVATVSVCDADFDAKIAAYLECPSGPGEAIACNDDSCGSGPSISFPTNAGTVYRIRIGGFNGQSGSGTMVIECEEPASTCTGDIAPAGGDGVVNVDDLLAVISSWGPCSGCDADTDGNNVVNVDDLLTIISAWGPCP